MKENIKSFVLTYGFIIILFIILFSLLIYQGTTGKWTNNINDTYDTTTLEPQTTTTTTTSITSTTSTTLFEESSLKREIWKSDGNDFEILTMNVSGVKDYVMLYASPSKNNNITIIECDGELIIEKDKIICGWLE